MSRSALAPESTGPTSSPTESESAESGSSDAGKSAGKARLVAVVIAGLYAWAVSVLPIAVSESVSSLARLSALLAPLPMLAAPFVPQPRFALRLALDGFLGLCVLSWFLSRGSVQPPWGVFGAFGWLAYTFALGAMSTPREMTRVDNADEKLSARTAPTRLGAAVLALLAFGSMGLLALAWRVERSEVGILAHICALGSVLLLLRSGALLAAYLQTRGSRLAPPLSLRSALGPLSLLVIMSLAGLVYALVAR